jgi:hypothetical protein
MRALALIALLLAACSFDAETPSIFLQVDSIPAAADHLDVTLTSSDSSVQPKLFRPSFQPGAATSMALSFSEPSATGTFTIAVVAADRSCPSPCPAPGLASGTTAATPEPASGSTANLQITLH